MSSELGLSILQMLGQGKHKAIPGRVLASRLGFKSDREARLEIRELIRAGHLVASTTGSPKGFFLAVTIEEAEEYLAGLRRRLIQDALRRRDFKIASRRLYEPGRQLELIGRGR